MSDQPTIERDESALTEERAKSPREHMDEVLARAGYVSCDEAEQIAGRYNASHFSHYSDIGECARYSIPADPRRDDDLRLLAFIRQARADRTRLDAIRAYVTDALGTSQMMRPVSLVLQKVLALLGDEPPKKSAKGPG